MSNLNNVKKIEINNFCEDYAALCKKHGLYLVFNDDVWLQIAGDELDILDVGSDLCEVLSQNYIEQ